MQWVIRFLVGGTVVCLFAMAGDVLRPRGFAGLFSAAPSVALATLTLTIVNEGSSVAATEARSMILGGVALFLYACCCVYLMGKWHVKAGIACSTMLLPWTAVALALRFGLLG
jgi:uncharacterized membrane protein (GlpM family)